MRAATLPPSEFWVHSQKEDLINKKWGVLLDLDQTLVLTDAVEPLRRRRAWSKVYQSFNKTALPPGTAEFVAKTSEFAKLGVVTTSPRSYAERLLLYHRLRVPVLIAYHDVTRRKPHPEPIVKAAEKLGLKPARCIHVGDQVADMEAAVHAGVTAIALSWDEALDKDSVRGMVFAICSNWDQVSGNIAALIGRRGAQV